MNQSSKVVESPSAMATTTIHWQCWEPSIITLLSMGLSVLCDSKLTAAAKALLARRAPAAL